MSVLVPGTGGQAKRWENGRLVAEYETGIFVEPNIDPNCFSIRCVSDDSGEIEEDVIHFCDWPALRKTIDEFQAGRRADPVVE